MDSYINTFLIKNVEDKACLVVINNKIKPTIDSLNTLGCVMEVRFRVVSPVKVFNLPLYEHHLVIDTRSEEEYFQGHIVSAIHYPSWSPTLSNEEQDASLLKFIHKVIDECLRPENPDPVVVYGTGDAACEQAKWLAKRLETLKKDRLSVAKVKPTAGKQSKIPDPVEYFCLTIADKTREVWLLEGGYDAFCKRYDYLCGNFTFAEMSPLPHHMTDHVYLGSRAVPLEAGYLNNLHITHLILSQHQSIDWAQLTGISVLKCQVKDMDYQDMTDCWNAAICFIDNASKENPDARILVNLVGRSRSASVVLAYLTKMCHMSLEQAWEHVHDVCKKIDQRLVYYDQLQAWLNSTQICL